MKNKVKKILFFLTLITALLPATHTGYGQLFSDNFDVNSATRWTNYFGSTTNITDYTAQFAFDYGTNVFVRNGVTNTIPAAPNSSGTTKGLKITVNKNDAVLAPAVVSLYPTNKTFSGDYSLKFDLWMNYNGGPYGGADSTEQASFGLNHSGTVPVGPTNVIPSPSVSDGVWFMVAGEAGTDPDYRAFVGNGSAAVDAGASVFPDRDLNSINETGATSSDPATHPLKLIFPSPQFESAGGPGKQWVQVEVRQVGGVVTWLMNGYQIAEHNFGAAFGQTAGNIMLGYMDLFSGLPSPKEDVYVIYDNVRVIANPTPIVVAVANNGDASEPSASGSFRISRAGSTAQALTVNYQILSSGTARPGLDYSTNSLSGTAVIPIGSDFVDVTVNPVNDNFQEINETVVLALKNGTNYDVGPSMIATLNISDDGDTLPSVNVQVARSAYELNPLRSGKFELYVFAPIATNFPISFTLSGTATNGTHYSTIASSATILAGQTNVFVTISPINDNIVNTDRTVKLTLGDGANATLIIKNDDLPPGIQLFAETFETNNFPGWITNRIPSTTDASVNYFFDYNTVGIPPAPRTTNNSTHGLRLQVNILAGVNGAINALPTNNFSGDYRLSFDMWQNYFGHLGNGGDDTDAGGAGSSFMAGAGIGTSGTAGQRPGVLTTDSVWFAWIGDATFTSDFRAYSTAVTADATGYSDASGVWAAGATAGARDNASAYYLPLGGETAAPAAQLASFPTQTGITSLGIPSMQWSDVVITKQGSSITWTIDGLLIATVPTNGLTLGSGKVFFTHSDLNNGALNQAMNFALYDNIRVESLTVVSSPTLVIARSGTNVTLTWTGSFTLQQASALTGSPSDWSDVGGAVSGHTVSAVSGFKFYRLRQ